MTPFALFAVLALGQPDTAFARGAEAKGDAKIARPHFAEAAKGYDAEWEAGNHSPALATNRSRAHALAGDVPKAILAARAGLTHTPSDADLILQLETLRDFVPYPTGTRPEKPGGLRTRLSPWDLFFIAAAGLLLVVTGLARRFTTRDGWSIPVAVIGAVLLVLMIGAAWQLNRESAGEAKVLVLIRPTSVRKGNGDTYPPRMDVDLPRGAEVSERLRRGGWVQVEMPGGVIGWVPEANTRSE